MLDVAIIGCGIVGAATAFELSRYRLDIAVFERENDVSMGTTRANSAILHAGYDPEPGTLMAKLNVQGAALAKTLCADLDVPYKQTGSLVLAFSDADMQTVHALYSRGMQNGVPGLRILSAEETHALEPNVSSCVAGSLLAPTAAVVNPWEYALALAETAVKNGAALHLRCPVQAVSKENGYYVLSTPQGEFKTKTVINAAGVYADRVHEMAGKKEFTIHPNRGEYFVLDKSEGGAVSHVIFQCPSPLGKGVLVAPTVHGVLLAGPNAEDVTDPEDVSTTAQALRFVADRAWLSVPCVQVNKSIRNFSGLRAVSDTDDFIVSESKTAKGFFNLAGIKSPGLTAAPAIAKMAAGLLQRYGLQMEQKEHFLHTRKKIRVNELAAEEIDALTAQNASFGRVVCRCETVTEGEILQALQGPIPPQTLDGVKRRCGAGLGRCQGGFCGPRVLELLARELSIPPSQVFLDRDGSFIVLGENRPMPRYADESGVDAHG